jgi:hypothetical protein
MGRKPVSRATYWRRRVVVFGGGMAVLTLLVWAMSSAVSVVLDGSPAADQGSPGSHAGGSAARALGGRGHRQDLAKETADLRSRQRAKPQPSAPSPSPSTAPASPSASVSPSPGSGQQPGAGTAPVPGAGQQACATGAVVLTLHSSQSQYGSGTPVAFAIGAVSAKGQPCQVNLGPRFVSIVVDSSGTPIWDSSSCGRGTLSRVITLTRGVPAVVNITWDRRTSMTDCPGQGNAVRAGTYTAAAYYGQLHSHRITFALTGRPPAAH